MDGEESHKLSKQHHDQSQNIMLQNNNSNNVKIPYSLTYSFIKVLCSYQQNNQPNEKLQPSYILVIQMETPIDFIIAIIRPSEWLKGICSADISKKTTKGCAHPPWNTIYSE